MLWLVLLCCGRFVCVVVGFVVLWLVLLCCGIFFVVLWLVLLCCGSFLCVVVGFFVLWLVLLCCGRFICLFLGRIFKWSKPKREMFVSNVRN